MGNLIKKDSWLGQAQLQYVETCLWWNGEVSRRMLIEKFNCSGQHASAILQAYLELNPQSMTYDLSVKRYLAHQEMNCLFGIPEFKEELDKDEDVVKYTEPPLKVVSTDVKRFLLMAVRRQRKVEIKYQSRSSNEAEWRHIAPHAFGNDGLRYHARAWCYKSENYKDFSLLRILDIRPPIEDAKLELSVDKLWGNEVAINLKVNPDASPSLKSALIEDYSLLDERKPIQIKCSEAMKKYVLYRMGLDVDANFPGGAFFLLDE